MTDVQSLLRERIERQLTVEELRAYLSAPVSDEERENVLDLVRWFTRRYPTPAERLAYARRTYARWQRTAGAAAARSSRS